MGAQTFAIIWRFATGGDVRAGSLELRPDHFVLSGGAGEREIREQVDFDDVSRVEAPHDHRKRLASRPALRVVRREAPSLLITTVAGVGMLSELFEALARGRANAPASR